MNTYPIIFENVLPISLFEAMNAELTEWFFGNGTYVANKNSDSKFFGQLSKHDRMIYYNVGTYILLKLKKHIQRDLRIAKIQVNGKLFGECPEFHVDFEEVDNCFTFVLFLSEEWDTTWGGEFVARDPSTNQYNYVPYIPNGGVVIPSHWQHNGFAPNTPKAGMRKSVAFMYCDRDDFEVIDKRYPQMKLSLFA